MNQWTVVAAMIPLVYGYSSLHHHGVWLDFRFDAAQRLEILLTLLQSGGALRVLATMEFGWRDAATLFVLWLSQFLPPRLPGALANVYSLRGAMLALPSVVGRPAPRSSPSFRQA